MLACRGPAGGCDPAQVVRRHLPAAGMRPGARMEEAVREHGAAIAAFWHYSFLYFFYHPRAYSAAVMVSSSRDGEYIARLAERFPPPAGALLVQPAFPRPARDGRTDASGQQRRHRCRRLPGPARCSSPAPSSWRASRAGPSCPWPGPRIGTSRSTAGTAPSFPSPLPPSCSTTASRCSPTPVSHAEVEVFRQELEARLNAPR